MAEVVVLPPEEGADLVAAYLARRIRARPDLVLGVATGGTPLGTYRRLARLVAPNEAARVRVFALDEYVGLPPRHPASYRAYLDDELVRPLGLDPARVQAPDGDPAGLASAGERYDRALEEAGGVDVQLVGIGSDGHIGFNEPGSSLGSRTRVKTLTPETRRDNARYFDDPADVPRLCVTQGVGTILRARHLILLAFGASKAAAVAAAVEGPVTASVPASAVQLHPHVTVVVDEPAAAELALSDYYRDAWEGKPPWQGL